MRNGDYIPSRVEAQYDAAVMLCSMKLQNSPENTVGIIATGGQGIRVLTAPTEDEGKLLACLHGLQPKGRSDLLSALKTATLALKHRKNKNGGQQIVVFCGSPMTEMPGVGVAELTALGDMLRKSDVGVVVVSLGEEVDLPISRKAGQEEVTTRTLLEALVNASNKDQNSKIITIPAGVLPSDLLRSEALIMGHFAEGGAGTAAGAGGGMGDIDAFAEYGGINPNLDPELALVMQMSLEEARQRERETDTAAAPASVPAAAPSAAAPMLDEEMLDEDELLRRALELSLATAVQSPVQPEAASASTSAANSAQGVAASGSAPAAAPAAADAGLQSVLEGLPGVDMDDPLIQAALAAMGGDQGTSGGAGQQDGKDGSNNGQQGGGSS